MPYQAIYFRDATGREPVNDAIETLGVKCQVTVDQYIDMLNGLTDANPDLPFPLSSAITNMKRARHRGFWELRTDCGRAHHRIIYRRSRRFFILLHMILTKKGALSEGDVEVAADRWEDFKARMDAIPRANPRAMGHDAP